MSGIVLDSGALIALEHNDRAMWAAVKLSALGSTSVIVPCAALAQVWRGTAAQAQLAKALKHCVIASFDAVARAVGELCGRTRTTDVCDAQVAIVAATEGEVLYTSDPKDMHRLISALGRRMPSIIRC
jgi:hypothetical protein